MDKLDRRQFVTKSAATVTVTFACLCGLSACAAYSGISDTPAATPGSVAIDGRVVTDNLAKEPTLRAVGGAIKIRHASIPDGLIIAHVEESRYEVVSLRCTHRGVELEYDHPRTRFQCPSLGSSVFTLDGANVSGPARRPLREYQAGVDGSTLTIRL